MQKQLAALLIEDNDEHATIIARHIARSDEADVALMRESMLDAGLDRLSKDHFDVVLLDLRLPDSDIDQTLKKTVERYPEIPVVVLSTIEEKELARKLLLEGAQDYLCKSELSSELLIRIMYNAIERKRSEAHIRQQAKFNQALFEMAHHALNETDILALMNRAIGLAVKTLNVEFAKIQELSEDQRTFLLKSGIGWDPGYIGTLHTEADSDTLASYTLRFSNAKTENGLKGHEPIIVNDLRTEKRFKPAKFLRDHGIMSGITVIVHGQDKNRPYGVLGVHSRKPRNYSLDEAYFLQTVASTLAAALRRKFLETQLQVRIQELDYAHGKKDEFLATLSHELRTPLNVILGNVELVRTSEKDSEVFTEALDAIERNAKIETQLVSDTLDVSRIITGKMRLNMESFPFEQVIDSAMESIKFAAQAKMIVLEKRCSPRLGAVTGDRDRLSQVMWNLLSNAIKFTPEGGKVIIEAKGGYGMIELNVSDTGKGISPENLPHVFDRFWQEDSAANRRYMGLGIGLAVVRHIVELHGGMVSVSSKGVNKGATFTIRVPTQAALPVAIDTTVKPANQADAKSALVAREAMDLKGVSVLLIDDSQDSLVLLSRLLKKDGAEVEISSSPFQGLAAAKTGKFDVLVSDIGMPELDGYQLLEMLRDWERLNHKELVPAIALTAYVGEGDAQRALSAGYQCHLAKPVEISRLKLQIAKLRAEAKVKPLLLS